MAKHRKGSLAEAAPVISGISRAGIEELRAAEALLDDPIRLIQVKVGKRRKELYVAAAKASGRTLSAWARDALDRAAREG